MKATELFDEKYHYMFDTDREPLTERGIECSDGWHNILVQLVEDIYKEDIKREIRVVQIKEKFGTLRFYIEIKSNYNILEKVYKAIGDWWHNFIYMIIHNWDISSISGFKLYKLYWYYTPRRIQKIRSLIRQAEMATEETCELCGKPGYIRTNKRWLLTLCDECNEKS